MDGTTTSRASLVERENHEAERLRWKLFLCSDRDPHSGVSPRADRTEIHKYISVQMDTVCPPRLVIWEAHRRSATLPAARAWSMSGHTETVTLSEEITFVWEEMGGG